MKTKHRLPISANGGLKKIGAAAALFWLMVLGLAQAADEELTAVPRDSVAFGRTYSEWAAAWWQWSLSIPATSHPIFDTADCDTGQSGPVFFLGGKACAVGFPCPNPGKATRSCTVHTGKGFKALFFPVVNSEDSHLEESFPSSQTLACKPEQPNPTINCLRKAAQGSIDPTTNLAVVIDGQSIPDLKSNFRVRSPAFDFTLPSHDNELDASGGAGNHTLHITGSFPQFGFNIDITYHIKVVP